MPLAGQGLTGWGGVAIVIAYGLGLLLVNLAIPSHGSTTKTQGSQIPLKFFRESLSEEIWM